MGQSVIASLTIPHFPSALIDNRSKFVIGALKTAAQLQASVATSMPRPARLGINSPDNLQMKPSGPPKGQAGLREWLYLVVQNGRDFRVINVRGIVVVETCVD